MILELHLQGEPAAVLRAVRELLKRLLRTHGVTCTAIRPLERGALTAREALELAAPLAQSLTRVLAALDRPAAAELALEAAGLVNRAVAVAGLADHRISDAGAIEEAGAADHHHQAAAERPKESP